MNAAARKKHCSLLMFDVPKPNPGAQNNRSFMIDYTTSLENSSIRTQDNFIFTSFVEPMRVRPQTPIRNKISELEAPIKEDANINSATAVSNDTPNFDNIGHTPRPPNAFILYRRAKQSEVTADKGNISNAMISKILSKLWKNEKEDVKLYWRKQADKKKVEHMAAHPGYVYRPKKSGASNKKRCRKTTSTNVNPTAPPSLSLPPLTPSHPSQSAPPLPTGELPILTVNLQQSPFIDHLSNHEIYSYLPCDSYSSQTQQHMISQDFSETMCFPNGLMDGYYSQHLGEMYQWYDMFSYPAETAETDISNF